MKSFSYTVKDELGILATPVCPLGPVGPLW